MRRPHAGGALPALPAGRADVSRHRRRSIALAVAGVALALLGLGRLAAGGGSAAPSAARVARLVTVRTVPAGGRLSAADLGVVRLTASVASPHQLGRPAEAIGRRTAVTLVAGAPVMDAELETAHAPAGARAVAVRLDDAAGIPAGDLAGAHADVYLTPPGRSRPSRLVIADALVVSATHADGVSVATLLLPPRAVPVAIAAESAGTLRLVVRAGSGGPA